MAFIALLNLCVGTSVDAKHLPKNTVILTAENWCPYTCLSTDENKGLMVDVVDAAFREVGLDVRYDYKTSWTRASQNIKNGVSDVLLGATSLHQEYTKRAPEFYIKDETVFVTLKNQQIVLDKPQDLHNYRIGVMGEYIYDDDDSWLDYVGNHPDRVVINISKGEPHLLNLLQRKRIEIAVVNMDVIRYSILNTHQTDEFEIFRKNISDRLHLGFAKTERGLEFRNQFKIGFSRLVKSDKLKAIYEKYQLEMPDFSVD